MAAEEEHPDRDKLTVYEERRKGFNYSIFFTVAIVSIASALLLAGVLLSRRGRTPHTDLADWCYHGAGAIFFVAGCAVAIARFGCSVPKIADKEADDHLDADGGMEEAQEPGDDEDAESSSEQSSVASSPEEAQEAQVQQPRKTGRNRKPSMRYPRHEWTI